MYSFHLRTEAYTHTLTVAPRTLDSLLALCIGNHTHLNVKSKMPSSCSPLLPLSFAPKKKPACIVIHCKPWQEVQNFLRGKHVSFFFFHSLNFMEDGPNI